MAKISIEEALKNKLPLPWKVNDSTGTNFLIKRRRPEDLTKELFEQLEAYGLNRTQIREMFYVAPKEWGIIMSKLDIPANKYTPKKMITLSTPVNPPIPGENKHEVVFFPATKSGKTERHSRLVDTAPIDMKKVDVAPVFRAHAVSKDNEDISTKSAKPKAVSTKPDSVDTPTETIIQRAGYSIKIIPSSEGGFAASIPELPGCISQGETMHEVLAMIEDARVCWLEAKDEVTKAKENSSGWSTVSGCGDVVIGTEDENGLNYQDRHFLGVDATDAIHQPTPTETEEFFAGPPVVELKPDPSYLESIAETLKPVEPFVSVNIDCQEISLTQLRDLISRIPATCKTKASGYIRICL